MTNSINEHRHGLRTTTVQVKNPDQEVKTVKDKQEVLKNAQSYPKAPAMTRSGLGITLSFDYQSIRIDAWTELPCENSSEAIGQSHERGFNLSMDAIAPEIENAKEFLKKGQSSIFEK